MKKKLCVRCGHQVGQGDRHALRACPPRAGHTGGHHAHKVASRRRRKRDSDIPVRGQEVAFIRQEGKIKGVKVAGVVQPKKGRK